MCGVCCVCVYVCGCVWSCVVVVVYVCGRVCVCCVCMHVYVCAYVLVRGSPLTHEMPPHKERAWDCFGFKLLVGFLRLLLRLPLLLFRRPSVLFGSKPFDDFWKEDSRGVSFPRSCAFVRVDMCACVRICVCTHVRVCVCVCMPALLLKVTPNHPTPRMDGRQRTRPGHLCMQQQ